MGDDPAAVKAPKCAVKIYDVTTFLRFVWSCNVFGFFWHLFGKEVLRIFLKIISGPEVTKG